MVKQPKYYFESILGIATPWYIQNFEIDERNKIIKIIIGYHTEKSAFSLFSKKSDIKTSKIEQNNHHKRWTHTRIGQYSCQISSSFYDTTICTTGIGRESLLQPHFIGEANRTYTHQLRQQVALANARGLTSEAIAYMLLVEATLVEEIINDIEKTSEAYRQALLLPTEIDPIWENMVYDKFHLKTQSFPLRLMLSKIKLNIIDPNINSSISEAVTELRKFFISQVNHLSIEVSQVCAITAKKQDTEERQAGAAKLVLPALKNSIWLKLITGKLDLKSTNVPLNLFLVRLRHAFSQTDDNQQRINTLNSLREFFRKNARNLRRELILINQLMNTPEDSQFTLPDESSSVWQRILKDDSFIPSSHIAYKLLLANLRSQLLMNPDPVVELNAARRIRDFIKHNQRFMQQELRLVMTNSQAH